MRLKFTIFVLLFMGVLLNAQDTINYLIITEARLHPTQQSYLELTNVGTQPVPLNQFKVGSWGGGSTLVNGQTNDEDFWIPTDVILAPGESFLMAAIQEYGPRKFAEGFEGYPEKANMDNILEEADFYVYLPEDRDDGTDSITPNMWFPFNEQWGGKNGFYIEYHSLNGDSIVVDQIAGMFLGEGGQNLDRTSTDPYDVAGVQFATENSYLVRRASIKKGNLDFANARGTGLDDSEWIPIPFHGTEWRSAPWTIGNHGDNNLTASTLESDVIVVDFDNKTMTVPWGVSRGDDIMNYFTQKPGIGWEYLVGPTDSLSHAVQTGDKLIVYVCGNDLDKATFDIIAAEPGVDANRLVIVSNEDAGGGWRDAFENGTMDWPRLTKNATGIDTIWGYRGGIPYATRVDSLLERLQKPTNADWEIVYNDGTEKPDLQNGDILKVIASNNAVREYYISILDYSPSHIAKLSSITWPDIPAFYRGLFGWTGDTIPNFGAEIFNYYLTFPRIISGVPALKGNALDVNSKVEIVRAKGFVGSDDDRSVKFIVTAEDDTTINEYKITLIKDVLPENVQPNYADPILSQVTKNVMWAGNDYLEVYNPGNQPLDLSKYMFVGSGSNNPLEAIATTNATNWLMRYDKYIPGLKWEGEETWSAQQYIAQPDLSVNKMVQPGDVFVMAYVGSASTAEGVENYAWPSVTQVDVHFSNLKTNQFTITNHWGETIAEDGTPFTRWQTNAIYMFKILNDSVRQGLKPATDPDDFELLDVIGGNGLLWQVGGIGNGNPFTYVRKPEINKGNPNLAASFGTTREDAEWLVYDGDYWNANGFGWPWTMLNLENDLGKHYSLPSTNYISTVSSLVYLVSEGYSLNEKIKGVTTGTSVAELYENIVKADTGQMVKVTATADGIELALDALVSLNDTLTVISADSTNITKYILDVTANGLSSNALITSTFYTVEVVSQPSGSEPGMGTISGIPYGTLLKTVVESNLKYPVGSKREVLDKDGAYLPYKVLNFDTTYVNVTVSTEAFINVTAENGTTSIIYKIVPVSSASDAFVTSVILSVNNTSKVIGDIPEGISTQVFMSHLVPAPGATIQLVDKGGFERVNGQVSIDDKLIVTSEDESKVVVYYLGVLIKPVVYLAYLVSDVYSVDQVSGIVTISGITTVSNLISNVTLSTGATLAVFTKDGVARTSGNLESGDIIRVTAGDEVIIVDYSISNVTGKEYIKNSQIELFPNPTVGIIHLTGLEKGQTIQMLNSVGKVVSTVEVQNPHEVLSIDNQPAGFYVIVVSNKDRLVGRYKTVKLK